MAEFLWGIAQHVNDPSSDLINILRRHLYNIVSNYRTETKLPENQKQADEIPLATAVHVSPASQKIEEESTKASCSKSVEEHTKYRSTYAQADRSRPQHRQVNIQCQRPGGGQACKATSALQLARAHRAAATHDYVYLKDVQTDPTRCRLCPEHRHVFKVLKHWPYRRFNEKEKSGNALAGAKRMLCDMLKYFKLDKIENLPEHCGPNRIFMLYRCTDIENPDENELPD